MANNTEGTNIPFNYDLDLITEKETVYDFISRLTFGKDMINPHTAGEDVGCTIVEGRHSPTRYGTNKVKDLLARMVMLFPSSLATQVATIKVASIKVGPGTNYTGTTIPAPFTSGTLVRVISERTRQDIKDCFSNLVMHLDVPYDKEDVLTFYYRDN